MPTNASSACTKLGIFVPGSCASEEEAPGVKVPLCPRSFARRPLGTRSRAVREGW